MVILDGKKLSQKILQDLKKEIKEKQLKLKLAVILVGEDEVSKVYIKEKKQACEKIGIGFELFRFPLDISELELKKGVEEIVKNPENSGVIIQLPLPKKFNTQETLNLIPPEKDVDVLSSASINKFSSHSCIPVHRYKKELLVWPPVVCAVKKLLEEYKISIKDKKIVLVGKGRLVGNPLSIWLENLGADFSFVDKDTKNIPEIIKKADIIISGVGKPNLITGDMVKEGVIIIDAGTSCSGCGSVGDIDFETVSQKAKYITPVPGGVGPTTVACLLENLVKLNVKP